MNTEHPNQALADPASPEPSAARVESCTCCGGGVEPDPTDDNLRALRRLRDLAMAVAEKLAAQILDNDAGPPAGQAAAPEDVPGEPGDAPKRQGQVSAALLAFPRIERGARQCILLSNKLHDDRLARAMRAAAASAQAEQQQRERRKSLVTRLAKEAIKRDAVETGGFAFDRLEKLDLRIDEEDIESDIGRIADSAIIARLLKDCGIEAPWELWAKEHWAREEIRLKPPGSVYAGSFHAASPHTAPPASGPAEVEPVEATPPQPAPLQPEAEEVAANSTSENLAPENSAEAEPPVPEPSDSEPSKLEPPAPEPPKLDPCVAAMLAENERTARMKEKIRRWQAERGG